MIHALMFKLGEPCEEEHSSHNDPFEIHCKYICNSIRSKVNILCDEIKYNVDIIDSQILNITYQYVNVGNFHDVKFDKQQNLNKTAVGRIALANTKLAQGYYVIAMMQA